MASSIIAGLLEQGVPANRLRASDPSADSLARLGELGDITTSADNREIVTGADVVVLAVKPQVMEAAAASIRDVIEPDAIVISIAAGITLASLEKTLGAQLAIVRCMPNTPALLRQGASALYANVATGQSQREAAQAILEAVGSVSWVPGEADLDAVTALSGSGPAYFFLFMEALVEAGVRQGLDRNTAHRLTLQTGLGAAMMAADSELGLAELRRRVTSPGGTTERAVQSFEAAGIRDLVDAAVDAAAVRSRELAGEME